MCTFLDIDFFLYRVYLCVSLLPACLGIVSSTRSLFYVLCLLFGCEAIESSPAYEPLVTKDIYEIECKLCDICQNGIGVIQVAGQFVCYLHYRAPDTESDT